MSYPTYQQTEELKIGQVTLTAYSDLECANLQVEYSLETKDVLNLIPYCINNHCGISLYSKSQEDAAKLEGVEIHRNLFPLDALDQQRYARDFMDLYHSLQDPVIVLPQVLIGELVLEALEEFYDLDFEGNYSPIYPYFGGVAAINVNEWENSVDLVQVSWNIKKERGFDMAITSFTKNFSVPKEKSAEFVDNMTKGAKQISLKNFTSKRGSLSRYQKELKNIFGR